MTKIKLAVFDFDGVLVDSAKDIARSVKATQENFNYKVMDEDEIITYVGFGAKYLIDKTLPGSTEKELEWYTNYYYEHAVVDTTLYPGVKKFLQHISDKGGAMCVLSNKPEPLVKKILKILEVDSYFNTVLGPESLKRMKPDPEGIIICMERNNAKSCETIMIGDTYTDIRTGKACGAHTCGVLYGIGDREKLLEEKADIYVNDLNDILKEYEF
ncbi:MAG TPA: HAD family hydrolase [Clostridia bacterium]|jgi:2-phosphoglycolate phosphatase|nr:HAD family hydrolase [Clostridiaceae bacterium]HOA31330.1 HAD family hydrolase [Clostridia bacterium]HPZ51441.1 HAD family hydrolase [Clostridia bacterium]